MSHYFRGLARLTTSDIDGAVKDLDRAIELDPSARNYAIRSDAHKLNKDLLKAAQDIDKAIEVQVEDSRYPLYHKRALIFQAMGGHDKLVMRDLNLAIEQSPVTNFIALKDRANFLTKMGNPEAAIKDYTEIINNSRFGATNAYEARAYLLKELARFEEALADLNVVAGQAKKSGDLVMYKRILKQIEEIKNR